MATAGIRVQPFAANSPWKTEVPVDAAKHPESDRYVAELVRMVDQYGHTVNTGAYGISTCTEPSYQRRIAVKYSNC